jgi:hypothetical protein
MAEDAVPRALTQSFAAVRELALGLGGLQTRLEGACDALLSLESREVPEPLREEFRDLIGAIMDIDELDALADEPATVLAVRLLAFHERLILGR